jgi:NAD(P)-dependent dehydrogenase (short-subunit alcohol dehydrogenase family)
MGSLSGKTIVVTGALGVLGRAVAEAAEVAGAVVARVDFARAAAPAQGLHDGVDLGDEGATAAVMARIAGEAGGAIDGLANIAGGFTWSLVADSPAATWEAMFRMNLATALNASRAAAPYLAKAKGGAAIVNMGANAATRAAAGMGPYTASKAAVLRLTEALAEELAGDGVRVNAILPSIIDTPTNRKDMPKADFGTWVQPADIASAIVFLLSDAAHAITGAAVPVTVGRKQA